MTGYLMQHTRYGFHLFSYLRASTQILYHDIGHMQIVSNPHQYSSVSKRYQLCRKLHVSGFKFKVEPFLLADIGEGIKEVVIKEWFVKEGDSISQFADVCEVQSDKASVTITSRFDGVVTKIYHEVEDIALVGKPLIDVEVEKESGSGTVGLEVQEGEAIPMASPIGEDAGCISLPSVTTSKVITTPAVRRLGMEYQIDLQEVHGTGKDGRILKEDVLNFIERREREQTESLKTETKKVQIDQSPPIERTKVRSMPIIIQHGENKIEPLKGYTKAMVKTMTNSMKIPHFGYCDEVEMDSLIKMRKELKNLSQEENVSISFMPFFIKAASMALSKFPVLNASLDEKVENITYKWSHNIGVAMDTVDGLVVPNVKGVQNLSILDIANEMSRLLSLGQKGAFSTKDLTGGTFSISNIGSIGGTYAKPLILPPEVAIGALGRIQKLPRFGADGSVIASNIMNVSWSADHRVIDGATMARFSNLWKSYLQNPTNMIVHLK